MKQNDLPDESATNSTHSFPTSGDGGGSPGPSTETVAELAKRATREIILSELRGLGVATVAVEYDGFCGDGSIDSIVATAGDGTHVELGAHLCDMIADFVYARLPANWKADDGSLGTMTIDVQDGTFEFDHAVRYTELYFEYWLEGG